MHTLPAEEQADSIEDENFQVSFSTDCLLTVDVDCTRAPLRQCLELGKCKFSIVFFSTWLLRDVTFATQE